MRSFKTSQLRFVIARALDSWVAQDTPWFIQLRFVIARALDNWADFIRPGASLSDIRAGMSAKTERKVRTAILAILPARGVEGTNQK